MDEDCIKGYELSYRDIFSISSKSLKVMLYSFDKEQYKALEHMKFIGISYYRIWYKPSTWFKKFYKFKWE